MDEVRQLLYETTYGSKSITNTCRKRTDYGERRYTVVYSHKRKCKEKKTVTTCVILE
jgi:hypothetical protein